jgi:hypothetical protein
MERISIAQTKDAYPFKMVWDLERRFYNNQQHDRSNAQCYDAYVTEQEADAAAGIGRVHPSFIDYVIEQDHTLKVMAFADLSQPKQAEVEEAVIKRMYAHVFLMEASRNNTKLITDIQMTMPKARTDMQPTSPNS